MEKNRAHIFGFPVQQMRQQLALGHPEMFAERPPGDGLGLGDLREVVSAILLEVAAPVGDL